jgi:RHS repeat-associated protein
VIHLTGLTHQTNGNGIVTYSYIDVGLRTNMTATGHNTVFNGYDNANGLTNVVQGKFTAREDDGTGLYYYRARYYHPALGRFASEDPIGYSIGDYDLFTYVANNPLGFIDPLGLQPYCFDPPFTKPPSPPPLPGSNGAASEQACINACKKWRQDYQAQIANWQTKELAKYNNPWGTNPWNPAGKPGSGGGGTTTWWSCLQETSKRISDLVNKYYDAAKRLYDKCVETCKKECGGS